MTTVRQTHLNSIIFEHTEEVDSLFSRKVTLQHSFYFKHLIAFSCSLCILLAPHKAAALKTVLNKAQHQPICLLGNTEEETALPH